jgi:hypothetical protein
LVTLVGDSILGYWLNYKWQGIWSAVRKFRPNWGACIKVCESSLGSISSQILPRITMWLQCLELPNKCFWRSP